MKQYASVLAAVLFGSALPVMRATVVQSVPSKVFTCNEAASTQRGVGQPYRGWVRNSDYNFRVLVPGGLTGWSGTAEGAPFHGFTIFLDAADTSCILFEIHLRVDPGDAPIRPRVAVPVVVGGLRGYQSTVAGMRDGKEVRVVTTHLVLRRPDQTDDASILFIAGKDAEAATSQAYRAFLGSLKFGR